MTTAADAAFFNILKRKISKKTGLDCYKYKDNYLRRRIDIRMKESGVSSYREYLRFLDEHPEEYVALLDKITVNVTQFFRDVEAFQVFKNEVLPQLLSEKKRRGSKILRIWSAGCATGEEPYTIAIILHEMLGGELKSFLVSILATDIDEQALKVAVAGLYEGASLRNVERRIVKKHFEHENGKYRIKDDIRRLVRFKKHDLISGEKFSHFDVIFCRNVMIYFSKELQGRLLMDFYEALNDGGFLILGRTETLVGAAKEKFACVNARERIYQKIKACSSQ
ncbi:MAG: protein-glutamate O-methyltransferase CheR [Candidatus Alkanophagales archaeon]|nr:MAG: protein-glutamate O-methyltransferase CheR [Candidatus Alkanophagales archaeon]